MAVLFSVVTITANDEEAEFLVGGIPREYDDLEEWSAFEDFMEDISEETEVSVHAEVYLYGEGETEIASPEEIVYLTSRIEQDDRFLTDHTDNIEDVDFTISWSPEELYEMEME